MENDVVRIYRLDYSDPERLTGLRELLVPATDLEKQPAESLSETNS